MDHQFIPREITKTIIEANNYFPVLTLTGPRQSGKTTLLRHIFNTFPYYSLEDLDIREFACNDPISFLNQHKKLILDEIQQAPELLPYIQGIVDNDPSRRFILSGSSQLNMLSKISQSLAGRTAVFELLPLSFIEYSNTNNKLEIDDLLFRGFYPSILSKKNKAQFSYPSYTKTYIEKDVRDLLNIKNLMSFQIFLKLCAGRIGSIFNASELANEVGVSSNTISSWLSILQASYIIKLLPPYFENSRKRLVKSPKLYFIDTGLACYLLGIESVKQLQRDKMRGHLFENFIIMEALKHRYNRGKESNLFFYRDSNQNEIDLMIKNRDSIHAIEIKSAMTYNISFEKNLKIIDDAIKERVSPKTIIYNGYFENNASEIRILNYQNGILELLQDDAH